MKDIRELKAGVVGTGFIGVVHVEALRRLGVEVVGVCAETPEVAQEKAFSYPLPPIYDDLDDLLADPRVDVVHIATPNDLHHSQVKRSLAAGKHVVCEKPLALTPDESAELVELADRSGLVNATNYNVRFYPLVQEARHRVATGELGEPWVIHGSYLQDWLLYATDWNWRLEHAKGGSPRAVADIGTHWLDAAQFVAGRQITAVMADLFTAHPVRRKPRARTETFAPATGERDTEEVAITTEDVCNLLLRFDGGPRGATVISQVTAGRKNSMSLEVSGSEGSLAWCSERSDELWIGHRDRPNEILVRDPQLMHGPVRGSLPGGHLEGFHDAVKELHRAVYAAVAAGKPSDCYPTFRDGHRLSQLAAAVLRSSQEGRWVEVN